MRKLTLRCAVFICLMLAGNGGAFAQQRRKVIIDQDCSGPGGSNMQTLLTLIQSPAVEVLGITVVSGNQWRDEEVARTLRLLELIGRTDIPVVPGAVFPLVRRRNEAQLWQARYGKVAFAGAWDDRWWHEPFVIPTLIEGEPHSRPGTSPDLYSCRLTGACERVECELLRLDLNLTPCPPDGLLREK